MVNIFKQKRSITLISALLSLYTLLAYHYPLFKVIVENLEGGFNGVIITVGFAVLMLATNFLIYNLLLYLTRTVGKWIIAFTLIGDAIMLYFVNTYDVLVTDSMMGNVFNTRYSEASGYFSLSAVLYVVFLGILPATLLRLQKIDYKSLKRFGINTGIAIATMVAMVAININNFTWIDRHATKLGSLLMPWSYTVNSVRYYNAERKRNQKEILLPDATITNSRKEVVVLLIGESARRQNFSLYGYDKKTNPLLENQAVTALTAKSAATYTTAGVKAILDHKPTDKLYEILPNYLYRAGVDVVWRTANWGEPPVHIEKYQKVADLKSTYPDADERYDGILTVGLKEVVESSTADKVLIVLHTSTSHGPTYYSKYPSEFEHFTPVCTTVEMAKAVREELINAYDNTILYTDYLVNEVIESMKSLTDYRSCVIFISDHGESLGENNLYMHGVPMAMAPKEQVEIPFIVWTSDSSKIKAIDEAGQYHIFHSTMDFLSIDSPVYDSQMSIFE
ncbi:MAG: phosphoethanolamine--lipid A transferase EptA [Alistipes sp.]|nr:phosphoethanolamine--lipid A transferase EptA [Alistipes sp.]